MSKTICFLLKAKQPTDAQLQAGNYLKKKLAYRGLTITIENHAGSSRSGKDRDGHEWTTHMKNDYGYINRTEGVDGDHVDCYIGPDDSADSVYIVHQRKAGDWKSYDEDKVMLGFESEQEATQAYLKHYDDPRFLGPVTSMPFDEFKEKVLATMEKPAMIKSQIVFEKSLVQPHLRRMKTGRVVSVGGYENNRNKQVELTPEEQARQGDLLAAGDTVTESRQELIDEHEHLVDVLNSPSHEDDKAEAAKQAAELAEYKSDGKKHRQIETDQFKRWFDGSKAVGSNGEPLVLYRGQPANYNKSNMLDRYYTTSPEIASSYGEPYAENDEGQNVVPVYIVSVKPFVVESEEDIRDFAFIDKRDDLISSGYDSITNQAKTVWFPFDTTRTTKDVDDSTYNDGEVAFTQSENSRIKSAIGNNGDFDRSSQNINKSLAIAFPLPGQS